MLAVQKGNLTMNVFQPSAPWRKSQQQVSFGALVVPRTTPSWLGFRQQDDPDAVTYELRVPGYRRRDLQIEIRDRVVTVRGSRTDGWFQPRSKKSFVHSFELPETLDEEDVRASLTRGILQLTIGKQPHARRRRIPIRSLDGATRPTSDRAPHATHWRRLLAWLRSSARAIAGTPSQA
jgi:HSP20 family molecular chaperone IbpA